MSRGEAAVTGVGSVSPAGAGTGKLWDALIAGKSLAATDGALVGLPVDFFGGQNAVLIMRAA